MGAMDLVKKNAIYLLGGDRNEIVWVGEPYLQDWFLDKQYRGQYYTEEFVKEYFKEEISLKEAIKRNLVEYDRFKRMGSSDKQATIKNMLQIKGISGTLNFLSQTDLHLSQEDLKAALDFKE